MTLVAAPSPGLLDRLDLMLLRLAKRACSARIPASPRRSPKADDGVNVRSRAPAAGGSGSSSGMRSLHVMGGLDPRYGGPAVTSVATAFGARLAGAQNVVVFPAPSGEVPWKDDLIEMFSAAGIGVQVFPHSRTFPVLSYRWGFSLPLALWLIANTRRFDLVHAHGAWTFTTISTLLAAKVARRPAVLSTHETLTDFDVGKSRPVRRAVKRAVRRLYFAAFDLVIVSSELELQDTGPRCERIAVVPHALRERPAPSPRRTTKRRGLCIGYLGRFDSKKNVGMVLEAVAGRRDMFLEIAGNGPEPLIDALHALADGLGIANQVAWRGFIDSSAKSTFFADVDVVVMPSEYECFGIAAAEAICAGVPVVVSTNTGVAHIVAKYNAGLVIKPTARNLRGALESLREPALLQDLTRGTAVAAREFDLDRHGARLWEHYTRLTAATGSTADLAGDMH
jgi:glycosyltransferase involved in cell wall biosynthesis